MDGNAHRWHAQCWFGSLRVCNAVHVLISCLFLKIPKPHISENGFNILPQPLFGSLVSENSILKGIFLIAQGGDGNR
jgi:hypothetical protein